MVQYVNVCECVCMHRSSDLYDSTSDDPEKPPFAVTQSDLRSMHSLSTIELHSDILWFQCPLLVHWGKFSNLNPVLCDVTPNKTGVLPFR